MSLQLLHHSAPPLIACHVACCLLLPQGQELGASLEVGLEVESLAAALEPFKQYVSAEHHAKCRAVHNQPRQLGTMTAQSAHGSLTATFLHSLQGANQLISFL